MRMVRGVAGVPPAHRHDADAHEPGLQAGRVLVYADVPAHANGGEFCPSPHLQPLSLD